MYIADLHIHSRFSRATSREGDLPHLDLWARRKGIRVVGTDNLEMHTGVVSIHFLHADDGEMAFRLEQEFGIDTRCGLHCAPLAHQTLGTFPQGTVRFSIGPFTTFEEVDYVQGAVEQLLQESRS